ncbi:MAG: amidohydrolase [Desulfurococcales archaeon]|nr:amidohydrolase [Desulfurococcales archaeon]
MAERVDTLINNALIVTMNPSRDVIPKGYVAVREGKIVDVGAGDGTNKYQADEVFSVERAVVTPGFICVHTHLYGILLTGSPWFGIIEPPSDFQQNLQRIWWPLDESLTYEDIYVSALLGSIMLARTGTTFFKDMLDAPNSVEKSLDYIEKAAKEVGIKGYVGFSVTQRRSIEEGYRMLDENERFVRKTWSDPNAKVKGIFTVHASFTVSDDLLMKTKELADKYGTPYALHVEEGLIDVYHSIERYGKRPIERMRDIGFLSPKLIAVHVVQANDDELKILKQYDVKIAHNPMSNMINGVGVPPVPKMLAMGITVGLGNDGYVMDVFDNMRAAYLIHKVAMKDPRVTDPTKIVEMATIDAAKVLGVDKHIGSIEVGKAADLTIISPNFVHTPLDERTVYGHLVNTFTGHDVWGVMVDGSWVVKDRKIVTLDTDRVMSYAHKVINNLWDRMSAMKEKYKLEYLKP